jgi:beta-glucosidase
MESESSSPSERQVFLVSLKRLCHIGLLLALIGCVAMMLNAQKVPEVSSELGAPLRCSLADASTTERKVDDLLKKMTLEEKVGQLVQYTSGAPMGPTRGRGDYPAMAAKGELGSLFNLAGAHEANEYQHIAVGRSRLHIPLLFGLDVIHGYRTTLPVPLALASTWDPRIVEQGARMAAQEASAAGVRWVFSPMVDIARDPRWGRITESEGEDPFLTSAMARAYVRGYQGARLDAPDSVAACAKHFVGYGAVEAGRDYNTTEISEHTLREVYLPSFYAALDEGSLTIMSAFNALNGVPASANPFTLTEVLRNGWKFPGLAVSDYTAIAELIPHGIALDGSMAALRAFSAGVDMDMESGLYHEHLAELVRSGRVSEASLDEAVRRALRVKFALGLFDHPYTDETRENSGPLSAANLDITRKAAEHSFVLLKNDAVSDKPVLPLSKNVQTVALIGPLADGARDMLGSWECRGRPSDVVTLRAALVQRLGETRVKFAQGGDIPKATDAQIDEAVAAARASDIAILALGESGPEMTGEAASRVYLNLPGRQEELLEKVAATGKPVVLLLFSGRPLTLPWAFAHIPAVLAVWFPGVQAGPAITNVLLGDTAPSGRLVVSWPRAVGQIPIYYNALNTGRPAVNIALTRPPQGEKEKYVSRYIDEQNSPQFPFGFGLTYTTFAYGKPEVSTSQLKAAALNGALHNASGNRQTALNVSAAVTNSGNTPAEETVQLYVRLEGTSVEEPVRKLVGFEKVALAPGEIKRVSFSLGPVAFAVWDIHNHWNVEPSRVHLWVSPNSASGEAVQLEITP